MGNGETNKPSSWLGDLLKIDFHSFIMFKYDCTYMEIAQKLGISIGQVKELEKQVESA